MESSRLRFQKLVEQHKHRAYEAARRILGDPEEALDVLQEGFLELFRRLDFVADDWAAPWLVRVVTNRAFDRLRRRALAPVTSAIPETWIGANPSPESALLDQERRQQVSRALLELSERQREVVSLRIYQDLSFREIAAELGISEGASKVHFRRGLRALRDQLKTLHREKRA